MHHIIHHSNVRKLWKCIKSVSIVALVSASVYIFVTSSLACVNRDGSSLLSRIAPLWQAGSNGHLLTQIREADQSAEVDVLFIGPSTAMVTFDPSIFSKYGISSFNLGSDAQTPLNSGMVLDKYLGRLRPRLVIIAVSQLGLSQDGLESFADFASNTEVDWNMVKVATRLRTPTSLSVIIGAISRNSIYPLTDAKQQTSFYREYSGRGHVRLVRDKKKPVANASPWEDHMRSEQIGWLQKCIEKVQASEAKCVVIALPVSSARFKRLTRYHINYELIRKAVSIYDVPFIDWHLEKSAPKIEDVDFVDDFHVKPSAIPTINHFVVRWLLDNDFINDEKSK